jgi:hypothetical protein
LLGQWEAYNKFALVDKTGKYTNGSIREGYYFTEKADRGKTKLRHAGEKSFGPFGILHIKDALDASFVNMLGAGIHSGQNNNPKHATYGCIRTTDDAMQQIITTNVTDPVTWIRVINNEDTVLDWLDRWDKEEQRRKNNNGPPPKREVQ